MNKKKAFILGLVVAALILAVLAWQSSDSEEISSTQGAELKPGSLKTSPF